MQKYDYNETKAVRNVINKKTSAFMKAQHTDNIYSGHKIPLKSRHVHCTLLIFMADGAPGKPGRHVLNAEISLNGPRPQALMPATRNLYAVPGSSSCRLSTL